MKNTIFEGILMIRDEMPLKKRIILGVIPIILLLEAWAAVTAGPAEHRVISPLILPSPWEVVLSIKSLWFEAELSRSALASAVRVVLGFLVGLAVAFPLGVLMGSFTRIKALFDPLTIFGAYTPIPALIPLTMSLFGIGELQKIMFLALAFIVYLLPMFVKAIEEVDNVYLQTALTLGARTRHILKDIFLGVSMPKIFHAMRLGFGIGWTYIILAEMVAADRGLGHIIIVAQRRGPREHIYLVLLVIVLIAYVTDKIWVRLGCRLFPYQER